MNIRTNTLFSLIFNLFLIASFCAAGTILSPLGAQAQDATIASQATPKEECDKNVETKTQKPKTTKSTASKSSSSKAQAHTSTVKRGVSIDSLEGPRLAAAIGHFSRARSLLISAVREFDAGLKIANPDLLMNSDSWRRTVMDQATELDKVLAPQPPAPIGGIKYPADSRLLNEAAR